MSAQAVEPPPRVLGRFGDPTSGPTLIIIGAVHGNEPAGYKAMQSLFSLFEESPVKFRGSVVGLVGNRRALAAGVRFIDSDLNRQWLPENVRRFETGEDVTGELTEARELFVELEQILRAAPEQVYALDIHSTSGPGPAFSVFDDSMANRGFALELEVPMVLGIEEELEGTLLDYLNSRGVPSVGFEAGQHDDPRSVDRAEAAIWVALRASGLLGREYREQVDAASQRLASCGEGLPPLVEVRYRHAIPPGALFKMNPGLSGFQPVERGEEVAIEDSVPVRAPKSGRLLMPLYQAQGEDGYYIIQPVKTAWLKISAGLRTLRLERFVHLLPGVGRLDEAGFEIRVDRRVARWLPLDFFHLLGYRRIAEIGSKLYLRRRSVDALVGPTAVPPVQS